MTVLSLEPIALSTVDVAPAAVGIAFALPELSLASSQSGSFALPQTALTEKSLELCLAENEQLTKALDQALSDVRQLVAAVESPVAAVAVSDDGRARSMIAPTDTPTMVGRDVPIAPTDTPTMVGRDVPIAPTDTPTMVGRDVPIAPQLQENVERVETPIAARSSSAPYQADDAPDSEAEALVASPTAGIVPASGVAVAAQRTVEPLVDVATPVASAASPSSTAVMPSQALVETANAVADALIVTPGLMRGEGVVTVQLKSEVLDGALVTIAVNDRQMEVSFASGSAAAAALIERNLPQIQQYLGARIHSFTIGVKLNRTRS